MKRMCLSFVRVLPASPLAKLAVDTDGTLAGSSKGKVKPKNQPLTFQ
jgi:hypothetical protein